MCEAAILKIRTEMNQNNTNGNIQRIGQFLLQCIDTDPKSAEKIMTDGKTIKASLEIMKNEARKNQVNGCGGFDDATGFAIVSKYFGIESAITVGAPAIKVYTPKQDMVKQSSTSSFDIKLEDLL